MQVCRQETHAKTGAAQRYVGRLQGFLGDQRHAGDCSGIERLPVDHLTMDENSLQFDLQAGVNFSESISDVLGLP